MSLFYDKGTKNDESDIFDCVITPFKSLTYDL